MKHAPRDRRGRNAGVLPVATRFAVWFAAAMLQVCPGMATAQLRPVEVALHLHCLSGVAAEDRARLDYWSPGVARGNPDPDCVAREPLTTPLQLVRVAYQEEDASTMALVWLELEPAQREEIDRAMRAHLRRMVAITVQNRIVGIVFLTGSTTDHRIPVYVASKAAAARLADDLSILLGKSR